MYWDEIKSKPMSISQILSMSLKIFKLNIKTISIIALFIFIPINIANMLIPLNEIMDSIYEISPNIVQGNYDLTDLSILNQMSIEFMKWSFIKEGINEIFGCIAIMAVAFNSYQFIDGKKADFKSCIEKSFSKWGFAIITILVYSAIMCVLYIFLVIPALVFAVYANFMIYCVIIKNQKGLKAILYSVDIVKHRFWKTLLRVIVISLIQLIVNYFIANIMYIFGTNLIVQFVISCMFTVVNSFLWVFQTLWFLNWDIFRYNFESN